MDVMFLMLQHSNLNNFISRNKMNVFHALNTQCMNSFNQSMPERTTRLSVALVDRRLNLNVMLKFILE